jgi:hypothetical protein
MLLVIISHQLTTVIRYIMMETTPKRHFKIIFIMLVKVSTIFIMLMKVSIIFSECPNDRFKFGGRGGHDRRSSHHRQSFCIATLRVRKLVVV